MHEIHDGNFGNYNIIFSILYHRNYNWLRVPLSLSKFNYTTIRCWPHCVDFIVEKYWYNSHLLSNRFQTIRTRKYYHSFPDSWIRHLCKWSPNQGLWNNWNGWSFQMFQLTWQLLERTEKQTYLYSYRNVRKRYQKRVSWLKNLNYDQSFVDNTVCKCILNVIQRYQKRVSWLKFYIMIKVL